MCHLQAGLVGAVLRHPQASRLPWTPLSSLAATGFEAALALLQTALKALVATVVAGCWAPPAAAAGTNGCCRLESLELMPGGGRDRDRDDGADPYLAAPRPMSLLARHLASQPIAAAWRSPA